ncbi:type II toxin-antitoxin system death-on-curing family toxin [Vannielia sp. SX4]|uniref:type II toxin-antitoxin system death-on-curing family toxin n=1 Tax=Vannielia sp. SX4 TaxID=3463852 RepID=UPI004057E609
MNFVLLSAELVEALHDAALNPGELQGRAVDKSLDGALARVDNRLIYGMIEDVFDLAAAYAQAIACGHCFNDANKRTAFDAMNFCLEANGITLDWNVQEAGDKIIALAQRKLDDIDLARWLREKARA